MNHSIKKLKTNLQNQFSEPKSILWYKQDGIMELAHYLKSEKYHLIICELSESKAFGNFTGKRANLAS